MNNEANRLLIVFVSAAIIVVMAVVIFLTWTADTDVIDNIGDLSEYLAEHNDDAGKLIVTLAALVVVVLAFLMIIVELAPEDEEKELRVKQAGAVTIVPAAALRQRLEEALLSRPEITAAKARVSTGDKGITTALNLTVAQNANIAAVSQEAVRVSVDTIQNDLGLPVDGVPSVRVTFADGKTQEVKPPPEPTAAEVAPTPVQASDVQTPPGAYAPDGALANVERTETPVEQGPAEAQPDVTSEPIAAEASEPPTAEPDTSPVVDPAPAPDAADTSSQSEAAPEPEPSAGSEAPDSSPPDEAPPEPAREEPAGEEPAEQPPSGGRSSDPGLSRDPWRQS
jgi:hypothetical protein